MAPALADHTLVRFLSDYLDHPLRPRGGHDPVRMDRGLEEAFSGTLDISFKPEFSADNVCVPASSFLETERILEIQILSLAMNVRKDSIIEVRSSKSLKSGATVCPKGGTLEALATFSKSKGLHEGGGRIV
ncbi:hypothetical protein M231_07151 [Tremella mesenterica]|uniref:Uncharacterized protein n=1 Tax=Tremella mesenterica TaxID=5217 RepID=A0A4Q1BC11_TREME|nr:hypothetical protein M231_07151 [Tremella mesenterica]